MTQHAAHTHMYTLTANSLHIYLIKHWGYQECLKLDVVNTMHIAQNFSGSKLGRVPAKIAISWQKLQWWIGHCIANQLHMVKLLVDKNLVDCL